MKSISINKKALIQHLDNQGFSIEIIEAFQTVDRENYVLPPYKNYAYNDCALPITEGSTISQPSTIAIMLELLNLTKIGSFLEIGSGCGYVLALVNVISSNSKIFGIEINNKVYEMSVNNLKKLSNIKVFCLDGKKGLPEKAPFDRILISAACQSPPVHLLDQLTENGIIVASVKDYIIKITKTGASYHQEEYPGFKFVPLI